MRTSKCTTTNFITNLLKLLIFRLLFLVLTLYGMQSTISPCCMRALCVALLRLYLLNKFKKKSKEVWSLFYTILLLFSSLTAGQSKPRISRTLPYRVPLLKIFFYWSKWFLTQQQRRCCQEEPGCSDCQPQAPLLGFPVCLQLWARLFLGKYWPRVVKDGHCRSPLTHTACVFLLWWRDQRGWHAHWQVPWWTEQTTTPTSGRHRDF